MMTKKLPKSGTITRQILEFVSRHNGVRFTEIQKFICEISGLDWEKREVISTWKRDSQSGLWGRGPNKTVRAYRGWWCTNLCYGPDSVCRKYLAKRDGRWFLNEETAQAIRDLANESGKSGTIYSVNQITPSLAANRTRDPLDIAGQPPASKSVIHYAEPAKMTAAQSFDPSMGVRLEFVPKVELPLGPTLPEGSFKIVQPQHGSDVELVAALRAAREVVNRKQAAAAHANAELTEALAAARAMEDKVRKALGL